MAEPYSDRLGRTIKVGDSVVFPIPYGKYMTLGIGTVKSWKEPGMRKRRVQVEVHSLEFKRLSGPFIKNLRPNELCIYKRAE